MEKIAILRWESGHVPQGLMQLEQLPGNSTNLASYPFPVKLVEVKGANTDTVILHPSQKLLEDMIQLAKELEKEGVRAITTSCGFNAIFQEALANAVDIPVFTSSLLQVPFAQALVGRDRAVGVITASASSLSEKHLRACGITAEMHPIVMGLENAPEWSKIFDHPDDSFDMDLVTEEILNVARQGVKDHPEIGAIVLECTDLPPFARRIREELDIPVFDFNSMIGHVAMALSLVKALPPPRWRERFLRVPGVPAQYAAGQPNRAILRKKQRPLFPEDPCFWIWNGWIFSSTNTQADGVSADYFRQRPTMV